LTAGEKNLAVRSRKGKGPVLDRAGARPAGLYLWDGHRPQHGTFGRRVHYPGGFQTGGHFMMRLKQIAGVAMLAAGLAFASGAAWAQDAAKKPHVPGAKAIGQAGGSPVP
jgi:hypothetical protein